MSNVLTRTRTAPALGRVVSGFCAGFIAVLVFHQVMLALLHAAGITPAVPYSTRATAPWGVPQVWSLAFWGGVWGVVFAILWPAISSRGRYVFTGLVFGAIAPTLVAWFVVAPLKGAPIAGGGHPAAIATALLVNAAWGVGTALLMLGAAAVLHIQTLPRSPTTA